jgi:hypothetical protein
MYETCRMLGEQREAELLREARRLHAGDALKEDGVPRTAPGRLVSALRLSVVVLVRVRGFGNRTAGKPPRSQLDS